MKKVANILGSISTLLAFGLIFLSIQYYFFDQSSDGS